MSLTPFGRPLDVAAFEQEIEALRRKCYVAVRDRYVEMLTKRALEPLFARWQQEGELPRDELIAEASQRGAAAYLEWKMGGSTPLDDEDMKKRVLAELDRLAEEDRKRGR